MGGSTTSSTSFMFQFCFMNESIKMLVVLVRYLRFFLYETQILYEGPLIKCTCYFIKITINVAETNKKCIQTFVDAVHCHLIISTIVHQVLLSLAFLLLPSPLLRLFLFKYVVHLYLLITIFVMWVGVLGWCGQENTLRLYLRCLGKTHNKPQNVTHTALICSEKENQ